MGDDAIRTPPPHRGRRLTDVSIIFWISFPIALAYRRVVCTHLNTERHLHAHLATSGVSDQAEFKYVSLGAGSLSSRSSHVSSQRHPLVYNLLH